MSAKTKRQVVWRLPVVMAMRGIKSATELHRRLLKVEMDISSAQLSRMMYARPKRLSTELLDALIEVLECELGDLLTLESIEASPVAEPAPAEGTERKKPRKNSVPEGIAGPKVTPFPVPPRKNR